MENQTLGQMTNDQLMAHQIRLEALVNRPRQNLVRREDLPALRRELKMVARVRFDRQQKAWRQ